MILMAINECLNPELLDDNQRAIYKELPIEMWLNNPHNLAKHFEWNTFFRRNPNRFIELYFGFKLYPYQHLEIYEMNQNIINVIIGSRATAKSFVIGSFACAKAVLYPRSMIVICSGTKGQGKLIVSEKIKNELMPMSPNLRREIKNIIDNQSEVIVTFFNGSTIKVVPALDSARGNRSTVLIFEEARQIDKFIVDSVLTPFQIIRQTPYLKKEQYKHLYEEATAIYITSNWYAHHWLHQSLVNNTIKGIKNGEGGFLLGLDYSVSLLHNIKTRKQILQDKRNFDPVTYRIEYLNATIRENTSAFFKHKMFLDRQINTRAFYPRRTIDVLSNKKNKYAIPKQKGEIRLLACDMAFVENDKNDNSIFSCIRLLPESSEVKTSVGAKTYDMGYRRVVSYLEPIQGGDVIKQAVRIKQLFSDFNADYCVLDARNGGVAVYDLLAKVLYDEERKIEYQPWEAMNNTDYAKRIRSQEALPCIFVVNATQKLNSEIAISLRNALTNDKIDLLIPLSEALESVLPANEDFNTAFDIDEQLFYERPFRETAELVKESVELLYEKKEQTGLIVISEQGANRKDRYTSVSYGNYFADLLEQDLFSQNSNYEYAVLVN